MLSNMEFELIIREESDQNISQFWNAVDILLNNPHTINRRILVSHKIFTTQLKCKENICPYIKQIQAMPIEKHTCKDLNSLLEALEVDKYSRVLDSKNLSGECDKGILLHINKLLPRNSQLFCCTLEFTFVNKEDDYILCFYKPSSTEKSSLGTNVTYKILFEKEGIISMYIQKENNINCLKSIEWLKKKLFSRIITWTKNEHVNNGYKTRSLSLVLPEKYAELYNELKQKYGTTIVKMWPENTDPTKYVYEDISIATYLILLWEKERNESGSKKLQTFLDLGCGNGLLVHILSSEGYSGLGIDMRERKIWNYFPSSTHLKVQTIIPSSSSLFPDVDWLIGNHSDELTPWIPVIAARSSYKCRFFLLPCCAYEFNGKKYQRRSASKSRYAEYISYVKYISEICGFDTQIDKLRIPSTKRICLIGWERNYLNEDSHLQDARIRALLNARSSSSSSSSSSSPSPSEDVNEKDHNKDIFGVWSENFKPRNPKEEVRNCTRLDKNVISDIVKIVSSQLLRTYRPINLQEECNKTWNAGGQIDLKDIVKLVPLEMLKHLRSEYGGIQTLLKNNSNIFSVTQGKVQFRVPGITFNNVQKKRKGNKGTHPIKVKSCWFHENHPDGCPTTAIKCNFRH